MLADLLEANELKLRGGNSGKIVEKPLLWAQYTNHTYIHTLMGGRVKLMLKTLGWGGKHRQVHKTFASLFHLYHLHHKGSHGR